MNERLYNRLPALYRIRDVENGEPLRALLGIFEQELDVLERDVAGLYDDQFIETCADWVVPYIGDLLGVRLLRDVPSSGIFSQRALVADTLSLRRRKGTLAMLEDLARDVTGWGAHAVAFFELLGWTQNLDHLRRDFAPNPYPQSVAKINPAAVDRVGTVNLRSLDVVDRLDGPFDELSHTVDVRRPRQRLPPLFPPRGQSQGWHNIRNLGIYLWRLQSYPMRQIDPRRSLDYTDGFHFSPLGQPAPLFTNPERKADELGLANERNVPGKIRPVAFFQDSEAYYGTEPDKSFALYRGGVLVVPSEIMCKDLSTWSPPPDGVVAVDVARGRIAFAPGESPADDSDERLTVDHHYGFSADIGGGPYDRRDIVEQVFTGNFEATVTRGSTIAGALATWDPVVQPRAVITIADNATYEEEDLELALAGSQHLILQADNRNRPTVRFVDADGALTVLEVGGGAGSEATLTLNGLLMEGGIHIADESLGKLEIVHSTLVPGHALKENGAALAPAAPSLKADPDNSELEVVIVASIIGALRLPETVTSLTIRDSILDRPRNGSPRRALAADDTEPGPPTTLERVTVFGEVHVRALVLASEVIFAGKVTAERRQVGCVRYSWVDLASITPRRFRCQPDLALETRRKLLGVETLPAAAAALIRSRVRPAFTARRYGRPGYAQLDFDIAEEIRTGAEDGAEMGAFEHLKQPQREANLRIRLDEYMPFGLDAGWIFIT